jgi:hypothetical protein
MRYAFLSVLIVFCIFLKVYPQDIPTLHPVTWPESDSDTLWYTVRGERQGISFFRQIHYPEVEYKAKDKLLFDRYHTMDVMTEWLMRWVAAYPSILEVYIVDESFEGRPIIQATLTNKNTGKDTDKPAAYFEGGRHSGEVTGSESTLWLLKYMLEQYGKDAAITKIMDTKALYFRLVNNPDGESLYLNTAQRNRSTVRPHDDDGDGLMDEDPEEDLDGDGVIYTMRWKAREGEKGNMIIDPADPSGRLMKRVPEGKGIYRMASEGIDNDGDGKYNEDGIGGLDLHRNYVENWRPDEGGDATKRGYTQNGAGSYPLSEVETRSVFQWMLSHPNIFVVNSMDTRVPMHLRPPSTSYQEESMFPEDLTWYQYFDSVGKSITHYPWAGDVYNVYNTRTPVSEWSGDSTRPSPLFGHGPDFGYFYLGAVWYGDELWSGGRTEDLNKDGKIDDLDALAWDDQINQGKGFREWTKFQHPALGEIEMGGFYPKFFSQNPPPAELEKWIRKQALFNLEMVKHLPQVEITSLVVKALEKSKDSTVYSITVSFTNTGKLPTAFPQAHLIKIVQEDKALIEFSKEIWQANPPRIKIVVPATADKSVYKGITKYGEVKTVLFRVIRYGNKPLEGTARILSTRGGVVERKFILE